MTGAAARRMDEAEGPAGLSAPDRPLALRRTGRRPLTFRGARLLSTVCEDADTGARFTLDLYRAEAGAPVAAAVFEPPPGLGGAPAHLAGEVAHPEALQALLAALDPAATLPAPETIEAAAERVGLVEALRAASLRFRAEIGDWLARPALHAAPQEGAAPVMAPPLESEPMNQMTSYTDMPDAMARQAAANMIALKRVGQKPLVFQGVETAMAMSFMPGAPSWYEINLYKALDGRVIAAVKLFHRDENAADLSRAWEFPDVGAAVSHLEAFDPAADIRVDVEPDDPDLSLPEMAAHALALRAKAAEARRQYRTILGEMLHEIEAA